MNLTAAITDARVSVSPASVGAGPLVLIVANLSSVRRSLYVLPAGAAAAQVLAGSGPIAPQGADEIAIDLPDPGDYTVTTNPAAGTDAGLAGSTPSPRSATIHIGPGRPSSSGDVFQP